MIDDIERAIGRTVRKVRSEAIVVISKHEADDWLRSTTVDVFKYLANDMKNRGRPYIKCVQWEYRRILMWMPNTTYARGLTAQLMFVAMPMTGKPTFTSTRSSPKQGDLQVWTDKKHYLFSFNDEKGEKLFNSWREFVLNDKASRARLGLSGEKNA